MTTPGHKMSKCQVYCGRGSNRGRFYLYYPTATDSGWTHFDTWEEAMHEASRRASIIEVELPRDAESVVDSRFSPPMRLRPCDDMSISLMHGHRSVARIFDRELEPLAVRLLAMARRKETL